MTRDAASSTLEDIVNDDMKNSPRLDDATLFKTMKELLDDGIIMAMEAQFDGLQNIYTQKMENTMNQKVKTLANVTVENMNGTIDQIREDNAKLRTQVANHTGEF